MKLKNSLAAMIGAVSLWSGGCIEINNIIPGQDAKNDVRIEDVLQDTTTQDAYQDTDPLDIVDTDPLDIVEDTWYVSDVPKDIIPDVSKEVSLDITADLFPDVTADVVQNLYLEDADCDGYPNPSSFKVAATKPEEGCYVEADEGKPTDCNDNNSFVHPEATEYCNEIDDDCDGETDEEVKNSYSLDNDGDGFGAGTPVESCLKPEGNYVVTTLLDCDDTRIDIYPGAPEVFGDGIDNNCDGKVYGLFKNCYVDADGDGSGDQFAELNSGLLQVYAEEACPAGYTTDGTDCDDAIAEINTLADELCDTVDNNCNGKTDEGLTQIIACDIYNTNENGSKAQGCVNGEYADTTECADPDECVENEIKSVCLCALAEDGTYKWTGQQSENTGTFPDGIDNDCDSLVDEDYFVQIPAGVYIAGCAYPVECNYAGNPAHVVEVKEPFYLSMFEITEKQYGTSDSNLPITNLTQEEAEQYCQSIGGRLPTADEWEAAAKGDTANTYPWGILAPNCNLTNWYNCLGETTEVGSYEDDQSPFGAYDMGGNVSEWTSTTSGEFAVVKGGNYQDEDYVRVFEEQLKYGTASATTGIRCVLDEIDAGE